MKSLCRFLKATKHNDKDHNENLKQCDAVILYYGNQNEAWERSMASDLRGLQGLGRVKPPPSKTICLANPTTPQKERFRSNEFTVVNALAGFNPQLLNDILEKIK